MSESLPSEPSEPSDSSDSSEPSAPSEPDERAMEARPKPEAPALAPPGRADWLVGPEQGFSPAPERMPESVQPLPRLSRPEDPDAGKPRERSTGPSLFPGRPAVPLPPPPPVMPAWDRGASSVPVLRRTAPEGRTVLPAAAEPTRDFPMDDAEERARVAALVAEQQAREAAIAARPHEVVNPQEFVIPETPQPWWAELPQRMRFDRRVQLVVLSFVLVLAVATLWPRGEKMISVAHLKKHPEQFADTRVRISGRVGEVFPVGGSWAYTLLQGRDTIVVFTRTRIPRQREHLVVVGTLSTGYLDGQSRVAIFESTSR